MSPVLTAMGVTKEIAQGAIRISIGKYNTKAEMKTTARILEQIVKKLSQY